MTHSGVWSPPGREADANQWNFDLKGGWVPPGKPADKMGTQYSLPTGGSPKGADWSLLASPPGVQAPRHLTNFTPELNRMHPPGEAAPADKMNLSMLPASGQPAPMSAGSSPWSGGVGAGQAEGDQTFDPNSGPTATQPFDPPTPSDSLTNPIPRSVPDAPPPGPANPPAAQPPPTRQTTRQTTGTTTDPFGQVTQHDSTATTSAPARVTTRIIKLGGKEVLIAIDDHGKEVGREELGDATAAAGRGPIVKFLKIGGREVAVTIEGGKITGQEDIGAAGSASSSSTTAGRNRTYTTTANGQRMQITVNPQGQIINQVDLGTATTTGQPDKPWQYVKGRDGSTYSYNRETGEIKPLNGPTNTPTRMSPGETLVDPATGRVIHSAPPTPHAPQVVGNQLIDPATGRVIHSTPQNQQAVTAGDDVLSFDPRTGKATQAYHTPGKPYEMGHNLYLPSDWTGDYPVYDPNHPDQPQMERHQGTPWTPPPSAQQQPTSAPPAEHTPTDKPVDMSGADWTPPPPGVTGTAQDPIHAPGGDSPYPPEASSFAQPRPEQNPMDAFVGMGQDAPWNTEPYRVGGLDAWMSQFLGGSTDRDALDEGARIYPAHNPKYDLRNPPPREMGQGALGPDSRNSTPYQPGPQQTDQDAQWVPPTIGPSPTNPGEMGMPRPAINTGVPPTGGPLITTLPPQGPMQTDQGAVWAPGAQGGTTASNIPGRQWQSGYDPNFDPSQLKRLASLHDRDYNAEGFEGGFRSPYASQSSRGGFEPGTDVAIPGNRPLGVRPDASYLKGSPSMFDEGDPRAMEQMLRTRQEQGTLGTGQDAPMSGMPQMPPPQRGGQEGGGSGGVWSPPLDPKQVVGTGHKFGEQVSQEGIHKGVDLQAMRGTPAKSPVDGVVTKVDHNPQGLGITVTIKDAQGHEHTLGHLGSVSVKMGDRVRAGQPVAQVGSTGASTGPHLDVREKAPNGQHVDPTAKLGALAQMPRADQGAPQPGGPMGGMPPMGGEMPGMGQDWAPPAGQEGGVWSAPFAFGSGQDDPPPEAAPSEPAPQPSEPRHPGGGDIPGGGGVGPAEPPPAAPEPAPPAAPAPPGEAPPPSAPPSAPPPPGAPPPAPGAPPPPAAQPPGAVRPGWYDQAYIRHLQDQMKADQTKEASRHSEAVSRLQQEWQIHQDDIKLRQEIEAENVRHNQAQEQIQRQEQQLKITLEKMQEAQAVRMSALQNPWLQRLTGMAPRSGMPGSSGAAGGWDPTASGDPMARAMGGASIQTNAAGGAQTPGFKDFSEWDPFSMAAWRTNLEMNDPAGFANASDQMRQSWASQGITEQPATTQLAWDTATPEKHASTSMLSDVFGTTPQQYQAKQGKQWAASAAPQVAMRA